MDKVTYLKLKQQKEINAVKYKREEFCYKCVRLLRNCLCSLISPFQTKIHFVILMHPKEFRREKIGTGRISNLSLLNSQIITGVDFTDDTNVNSIISDKNNYCLMLYPGKKAINISEDSVDELAFMSEIKMNAQRLVVFLLDGTWPCAKKMMRESSNLRRLPRVTFSAKHTSIFEIKEQPADFCLSTLESIHFFIKECNRKGIESTDNQEDQMIQVFKSMINYQIECSLNPEISSHTRTKLGYSKTEDRTTSKKWLMRNIVLAD